VFGVDHSEWFDPNLSWLHSAISRHFVGQCPNGCKKRVQREWCISCLEDDQNSIAFSYYFTKLYEDSIPTSDTPCFDESLIEEMPKIGDFYSSRSVRKMRYSVMQMCSKLETEICKATTNCGKNERKFLLAAVMKSEESCHECR
jgi:hypothetical protein